jgi:hypothetical protein
MSKNYQKMSKKVFFRQATDGIIRKSLRNKAKNIYGTFSQTKLSIKP